MTKRDLIKWLEGEKSDALKIAKERRDKMQRDAANKIYEAIELEKFIIEMEASFQDIVEHFDALADRCKRVQGAQLSKFHWKLSCAEYIHFLEDMNYLRTQAEDITRITECDSYKVARRDSIAYYNNVEKTYDNVIQTVKNLPYAKDGIEYLQKLGFNVAKILPVEKEKQLPATISVNVDTKYLIFDKEEQ